MEKEVKKVKNILVPTDLSEVCDNAIYQAIEIVKEENGIINVLHIDSDGSGNSAITKLDEIIKKFNYKGIVPIVKEGGLYETINLVATELNVDLILMATHGKKGLQKFIGSFALKVIDSTKIPVLVVQQKLFKGGFKNILFPVSLSDEDRQKTAYAVKLAKMFDSRIHIFPRFETSKIGEKQMINTILQIKSYLNKYDIDFEVASLLKSNDNFQKKVLAYSNKIGADLILIINDASNHLPLIGAKEETLIFNDSQTPVLCIEEKKSKKVNFSTAG